MIFTADIDTISDYSNWLHGNKQDIISIQRPLWIVMEVSKINKRMWISHEYGILKIATAHLNLNVDSKEYHDSYQWYSFSTQRDLCNKLKELLEPCLKQEKEQEEELEYDR